MEGRATGRKKFRRGLPSKIRRFSRMIKFNDGVEDESRAAAGSGDGTELINVRGHAVPSAGAGARRFVILTFVDWSARGFLEVQSFDPRAATIQASSVDLPPSSNFQLLGPTGRRLYCEKLSARASFDADGQLSFT